MREKSKIGLLILLLFFSPTFLQAQYKIDIDPVTKQLPYGLTGYTPKNQPKIALALSGGGARGFAQVGVLKALAEAGVDPDIIVGTSMGSIVGGMYAVGYGVNKLDSVIQQIDWEDIISINPQTNRRDLFVDQKVTEDKAVFTLRLDGLSPVLPTSFNDGQKLSNNLNILVFNAPIHSDSSFDLLKVKFGAVCTDLVTGKLILINKGSLSNALRASSSVTFFLAPVKMDSLLLVDGGLVANIPVDVAKQSGGDFVIAVNTTSDLWSSEYLDAPWIVADQIISIPMKQNNLEQLTHADFVITPNLNNILSTDFELVDSLTVLGYDYAKKVSADLKNKIDSVIYNSLPDSEIYFRNIKLPNNISLPEKDYFYKYELLDSVSNKQINSDLYRLFNTGNYKNLSVEIDTSCGDTILKVIKEENPIIKKINVSGISLLNTDTVNQKISKLKNQHYSGKKIEGQLTSLLELYRNKGYSLAQIQKTEFNRDNGSLNIFVDEGIIHKINVVGNLKTNRNVITREFNIKEGDLFRINEIKNGLTNLSSTKLFDNIDVVVKKENSKNVLVISVSEKPSSLLRLSFRSDNEYQTQLGIDLRDENILGTGMELGLILFGGLENRAYILEQKANRIFSTYFTYKINAYYKFNDVRVYSDVNTEDKTRFSRKETGIYRQIFYGLSLGVGTQVGRFGNLIFEGKYQFDQIKNRENTLPLEYKTKIVSLKISSTVDTQDKYPFPNNGVYFSGFYETALSILGGETGFSNIGFQYKNYFSISNTSVISPKLSFGFADKTLPLSEQYSLGGQDSFFGMHANEYRGRQIFLASMMYRYKLPFRIFFDVYLKARYDLGSTWPEQEKIRFKDLKHGIGGAISFDTPIGPAEFAVGRSFLLRKDIPQNPISWGDYLFYFSIGFYY